MKAWLYRWWLGVKSYLWIEPVSDDVLVVQMRWMRRNSVFAVTASTLGVWVILFTLPSSFLTLALGLVYTGYALIFVLILQSKVVTLENVHQQTRLTIALMTGLGLCLAGVGGGVFLSQDLESVMVFAIIGAGILAGALGFSSVHLPVFLGFLASPFWITWNASAWYYNDARLWQAMFWGVPILGSAYLYFGVNAHRTSVSSIQLRFANRDLLQQLESQVLEVKEAQTLAEQANMAKSKFLAAASHDLRQPVQALGLFLEAIERKALGPKDKDILENADRAFRACRQMLDALLDFSRIEAGIVHPRRVGFALQPLLYTVYKEFGALADQQRLVLRLRDTSACVSADPLVLEMVLRNLLANALRYTHAGGVLLGVRTRQEEVIVEVWDTGVGIAPAEQEAVFKEFHQLGNPERDHRKGLGLGLAIAKGLVESMGGRISLKSRVGRGSVFRVHLAIASALSMQANDVEKIRPVHPLRDVKVLLIDDNPMVLTALAVSMDMMQLAYRPAETIDEALACVDDWLPDVVVTDYRLRGNKTGGNAVQMLRQRLGAHLPAIIITGDTEPARLREAHSMGAVLLHKPITLEKLVEALHQALGTDRLAQL